MIDMSNPEEVMEMLHARIAEREAELAALRRGVDNIKVRSYELGQKELHDMALKVLRGETIGGSTLAERSIQLTRQQVGQFWRVRA